jgi:TonB family protein
MPALETPGHQNASPEPPGAARTPETGEPSSDPTASESFAATAKGVGSPKTLNLVPNLRDLSSLAGRSEPPDPAGASTTEVTVALGERDVRYRSYLDRVQERIDGSWKWREALLAAGRSGSVLVRFTLAPGGKVEDVGVEKSSGSPILDGEAVETVRRSPLPGFPSHWTIARLHLYAQFDYRLE